MNISLENWLRNKLQENEEMHDYAVATDTVRCWIDEYKQLSQPAVISQRELLLAFQAWRAINEQYPECRTYEQILDEFLSHNSL
jgi:hypothetical protein